MRIRLLIYWGAIALSVVACDEGRRNSKSNIEAPISAEKDTAQISENARVIPVIRSPACAPYAESIDDPQLAKLIKKLKQSIAKKDTALLLSLMDTNVITSYGGAVYGYQELIANWKMDRHDLWQQLNTLIEIGGSYSPKGSFSFPYFNNYKKCNNITKTFWENEDPYWTYLSIKDTVLLYNAPDVRANVKAKLRYAFVHVKDYNTITEKGFIKVATYENDMVGFVKEDEVYRTGGYSLHIEQNREGVWRITAFAPYD